MKSRNSGEGKLLTAMLERAPAAAFVCYATTAAFCTYFCMYAFRKPFAAATFEGDQFLGTDIALKTAIVISQIIGYAVSKLIGIKVCSEIRPGQRALALLGLVGAAQLALVCFAVLPPDWRVVAIFFNGLPLGMVWGMVVWYLEGRRTSELLLAGLSCSFIVASGIVKDIGRAMMEGAAADWWTRVPIVGATMGRWIGEVSEAWMPAVVGFHFLPLFFVSVWLLNQLPPPSTADVAARVGRQPMFSTDRLAFVRQFMLGILLLCVAYFFLTAYRDFRDNFQVEVFDELGYAYEENKTIISRAETIVAFGVIGALALLNLIRDNRRGLIGAFGIMTGGLVLMAGSTLAQQMGWISGFWWMTLVGLGSYLAYVPYGSVLFDRLIASTGVVATAVFAIYLADTIGYCGAIGVMLFKDILFTEMSRLAFFRGFTWFMSALGFTCLVGSCVYFLRRGNGPTQTGPDPARA